MPPNVSYSISLSDYRDDQVAAPGGPTHTPYLPNASTGPATSPQSTTITQNAHGISLANGIPTPIHYQGSSYVESSGDSLGSAAQLFAIATPDANTLEVAQSTTVQVPSHPFAVGQPLYLADAGLGVGGTAYTQVVGDSTNQQPLGIAASSTQLIFGLQPAPLNPALLVDYRDEFTATDGQTTFTLTHAPSNPDATTLYVNAGKYDIGDDYTISGTTLTWLNSAFLLDAGDNIELYYQY